MPENDLFNYFVSVGGERLEENSNKDNHPYIEVDLLGKHGRMERITAEANGNEEVQDACPVLAYQVVLHLDISHKAPVFAFVEIDGYSVCRSFMKPGQTRTVRGFRDGDSLKEFLFTLPSLSSKKTCSDGSREVGVITVTIKEAVYRKTIHFYNSQSDQHVPKRRKLEFAQATKKDSYGVTNGRYLMVTTKVGEPLHNNNWKQKPNKSMKHIHFEGRELDTLKLYYRVKTTIINLGHVNIDDDEDGDIVNADGDGVGEWCIVDNCVGNDDIVGDSNAHVSAVMNREVEPVIIDVDKEDNEVKPNRNILRKVQVITILSDDEEEQKVKPLQRKWFEKDGVVTIDDSDDDVQEIPSPRLSINDPDKRTVQSLINHQNQYDTKVPLKKEPLLTVKLKTEDKK